MEIWEEGVRVTPSIGKVVAVNWGRRSGEEGIIVEEEETYVKRCWSSPGNARSEATS